MDIFAMARMLGSWLAARLDIRSEEGATAVEYGLIVALIAAIIVTIVAALGLQVQGGFDKVCDAINTAGCTP